MCFVTNLSTAYQQTSSQYHRISQKTHAVTSIQSFSTWSMCTPRGVLEHCRRVHIMSQSISSKTEIHIKLDLGIKSRQSVTL